MHLGCDHQDGHHLGCAIQTELIVELELALIERKQSRRFRYNSISGMAERFERVRVGWHCAKMSRRPQNRKTQSKDL